MPQQWATSRLIHEIPLALPANLPTGEIRYFPNDLSDDRRIRIAVRVLEVDGDRPLADWILPTASLAGRITYVYAKQSSSGAIAPVMHLEDGTVLSGEWASKADAVVEMQTSFVSADGQLSAFMRDFAVSMDSRF